MHNHYYGSRLAPSHDIGRPP